MNTISKNIKHFVPNYIKHPTHPITIAIVGCGGTGSLMLARMARLDAALKQLNHPGIQLTAYDDDKVEKHNIGRQNFGAGDVGRFKASCLIEKVNFAFGLSWEAENIRVDSLPKSNITISCVDNPNLRMQLHKEVKRNSNNKKCREFQKQYYWLDTGNGKDFGQVILATVGELEQPKVKDFETTGNLPTVIDIFGDLEQYDNQESQGMESCSFVESIKQQDLFINDAIAVGGATLVWKLFRDLFIEDHGISINQKTLQQTPFKIR